MKKLFDNEWYKRIAAALFLFATLINLGYEFTALILLLTDGSTAAKDWLKYPHTLLTWLCVPGAVMYAAPLIYLFYTWLKHILDEIQTPR